MSEPLPVDVVEAAVQVAGTAFHYKKPLQLLMQRAGVPESMWLRYEHASKFAIARHIFGDLEAKGEPGHAVQHRIVAQFISLRSFSPEVDTNSARGAVENLRELSRTERLETEIEARDRVRRIEQNKQKQTDVRDRGARLRELKERFQVLVSSGDPQSRGFELEKLIKDLFRVFDIEYRQSFRTDTEQIDGAFKFGPFDYLVEAKWTQEETSIATLDSFKTRVARRITSTRGLFLSMAGFRGDVIAQFATGTASNVLLMTGEDLVYVLEERCSLTDALQLKADRAAHEGAVLVSLRNHF